MRLGVTKRKKHQVLLSLPQGETDDLVHVMSSQLSTAVKDVTGESLGRDLSPAQ